MLFMFITVSLLMRYINTHPIIFVAQFTHLAMRCDTIFQKVKILKMAYSMRLQKIFLKIQAVIAILHGKHRSFQKNA